MFDNTFDDFPDIAGTNVASASDWFNTFGFPSTTPSTFPTPSAGRSIDWNGIIGTALRSTSGILTARLAVPPPGTFIQTPQGIISRPAEGSSMLPTGFGLPTSNMLPWLIGGAALLGLVVVMKGR